MWRRTRVLVAVDPPLLASLVRDALVDVGVDVDLGRLSRYGVRRWNVAVVQDGDRTRRARHVVYVDGDRDFPSLIAAIRRLAVVSPDR